MTVALPPTRGAEPDVSVPVTVLVVDDSPVQRRFVRSVLANDAGVTVVGEAGNGREALAMVEQLRPRVVLMDLHLPVMNGVEAIERIMAVRPTPILVYSAFVDGADRDNAAAALAAGAVDVLPKPGSDGLIRLEEYAETLRRRVRLAGRVTVITHPRARLPRARPPLVTLPAERPAQEIAARASSVETLVSRRVQVLAIGASTGGPQALGVLLAQLPADLEAAVVVVQHMAAGFIEGLAQWLDELCALPVSVGANGRRLLPGTVTVAPCGLNLVVHDKLRVTTHEPPPSQFHVPGIDVTFSSVAEVAGAQAIGVLLTGMGRDGATGLARMRERGAFTIAQDEASSAVYGMPAAAVALGAADLELGLDDIGPTLRRLATAAT